MAYDYATFSTLAGPLTRPAEGAVHHVEYRRIMAGRVLWQVMPLLIATLGLSSLFFVWLLQPQHYPSTKYIPTAVAVGNHIMFWLIVVTEGIRLLSSIILCWSSVIMRDPVPVLPPPGLRVAFTTTIVPSKEPVDIVRDTLIAARNIQYSEQIDVWLLDEGNDPAVKAMCRETGVHHFSRKGVEKWNTPKGRFRAKTKHGNHNSWLDANGHKYDVVLSVDPDHIPLPNFADRMLGYFRDPNVAFVVGPQVYGNFRHYLTRGAEAQNYMFHSVIQRAANRFAAGMFVGTNHAYRVSTWEQIGGFQDSITEDLATSFAVHGSFNEVTGHRWTSVYTPDVVAVGEGPANWTDFFSQQLRWARGANEVMVTEAPRRLKALSWGPRLHYLTLMVHYPTVAITWIVGNLLTVLYMALGSTGVLVNVSFWLALYVDVFVARMLLYFWLRRFNISPHEEKGSAGMSGIFVSVLCTPFYSTAFVGALTRRKLGFVVTPKGNAASPDRLMTFRKHLFWAAVSGGSVAGAAVFGHLYPANMVWASLSIITCLIPIGLWLIEPILAPRRAVAPNPLPAAHIPPQRTGDRAPADARPGAQRRADRTPAGRGGVDPATVETSTLDPSAADTTVMGAIGAGSASGNGPGGRGPGGKGFGARPSDVDPATVGTPLPEAPGTERTVPPVPPPAPPLTQPHPVRPARPNQPRPAQPRRAQPGRPAAPGRRRARPAGSPEHAGAGRAGGERDDPTLTGLEPVGARGGAAGGGDAEQSRPRDPGWFSDDTVRTEKPRIAAIVAAADANSPGTGTGTPEDTVRTSRPVVGAVLAAAGLRRDSADPDDVDQDTVVTLRSRQGSPEEVLAARRAALAREGRSPAGVPHYTEDVTMTLHPRRRRVSLDGLLEEIG
ncbi:MULTISPECIES: glycosyltransferase family 2 protein [unclassified Parafrankia]|uniref:glycosyltransferase family 2 protein n=1 Tax=unclassified Parafrankia TaxID=2994368 RepID=UPI000DA4DBFE|nr:MULTISPECIES: cellulose synthase catalytic subunit [unclassified Parafrankia]TCJ35493.1 glycosyltransferase [Parafrankia sp. BMG5.11]SQD99920.1 Glycosyl transferase [Parafrankia sp. Ea1.12]